MPKRIPEEEGLRDRSYKPAKRQFYVRCQMCDVRCKEEQPPLQTPGQPGLLLNKEMNGDNPGLIMYDVRYVMYDVKADGS